MTTAAQGRKAEPRSRARREALGYIRPGWPMNAKGTGNHRRRAT